VAGRDRGLLRLYEDEGEADLSIMREVIDKLIEACPHEDVKAWARAEWLGRA
jgi:hypothetical protein